MKTKTMSTTNSVKSQTMKKIIRQSIGVDLIHFCGPMLLATACFSATAADSAGYSQQSQAAIQKAMQERATANATAAKEQAIQKAARASADCDRMRNASLDAAKKSTDRHVAPNPTRIIETDTCFIDVQSIEIPKTGWGWADSLVANLISMGKDKVCKQSADNWSKIVNAAKTGNVSALVNMQGISTSTYNPQTLLSQAVTKVVDTAAASVTGSPSGPVYSPDTVFTSTPDAAMRFWANPSSITDPVEKKIVDQYYMQVVGKTGLDFYAENHKGSPSEKIVTPVADPAPVQKIISSILGVFQ